MNQFLDLVQKTRTCRRFKQDQLPADFLDYLIEIARACPSGRNAQPLKYIGIQQNETVKNELFPHLRWAGSLKDWDGPSEEERPTAYMVLVLDKTISQSAGEDTGIVVQSMQLGAMELGIGSCMIGAFIKNKVHKVLNLNEDQEVQLILALGYPSEERIIVDLVDENKTSYYRDAESRHYVPKRSLDSLTLRID